MLKELMPVDDSTEIISSQQPEPKVETRVGQIPVKTVHPLRKAIGQMTARVVLPLLVGLVGGDRLANAQNQPQDDKSKTQGNVLIAEDNKMPSQRAFDSQVVGETVRTLSTYSVEKMISVGNETVLGLITDDTRKQYVTKLVANPTTKAIEFQYLTETQMQGNSVLASESNPNIGVVVGRRSDGKYVAHLTNDGWANKEVVEIPGMGARLLQKSPDDKFALLSQRDLDGAQKANVYKLDLQTGALQRLNTAGVDETDMVISLTKLEKDTTGIYRGYGTVASWRGYFKVEVAGDNINLTNMYPEDGASNGILYFIDSQGRKRVWLMNNWGREGGVMYDHINDGPAGRIKASVRERDIRVATVSVSREVGYLGAVWPISTEEAISSVDAFSVSDPTNIESIPSDGDWLGSGDIDDIHTFKIGNDEYLAIYIVENGTSGSMRVRRITNGINSTDIWRKITKATMSNLPIQSGVMKPRTFLSIVGNSSTSK